MVVWLLSWNNKITDLPTGGMPPVGHEAQTPNEFPDVRLHERAGLKVDSQDIRWGEIWAVCVPADSPDADG